MTHLELVVHYVSTRSVRDQPKVTLTYSLPEHFVSLCLYAFSGFTSLSTAMDLSRLWSLVVGVTMTTFHSAVTLEYHAASTRHNIRPRHIIYAYA